MKLVSNLVQEQRFVVVGNTDQHLIDQGGNHFINGVHVGPFKGDYAIQEDGVFRQEEIGCTYPLGESIESPLVIKRCTQEESDAVIAREAAKAAKRLTRKSK